MTDYDTASQGDRNYPLRNGLHSPLLQMGKWSLSGNLAFRTKSLFAGHSKRKKSVTPVEAGVQESLKTLDSRFRGNDPRKTLKVARNSPISQNHSHRTASMLALLKGGTATLPLLQKGKEGDLIMGRPFRPGNREL